MWTPARLSRVPHWLAHPRARRVIIALALVLSGPCLASGLALDDYVLALKAGAAGRSPLPGWEREPLWLFTFTTGDPARNRVLMDQGVLLPWWTEPRHLNAFFRPLSSLSHLLDFSLWPGVPSLMHLHSLAWYALLLLALSRVYAVMEASAKQAAPALLGLSLLLFALDDAHGATVGWIANRNALIATCLALPALVAQHRAAAGRVLGAWLGPIWFGLGLAAGEAAVCVLGYVVAHMLWLDGRRWRQKLLGLAPYLALLCAHRAVYHVFGLGSFGSAGYHDPLREPVAFVSALAYNLPVLLSAQLSLPLADFAFWGDPEGRPLLLGLSLAGLLAFCFCARDVLRSDPRARFWATGLVLSAIPLSASVPGERLLLVLGVGASPLLARLILAWIHEQSPPRSAALAAGFAAIHLLLATVLLPVRAYGMAPLSAASARIDGGLPDGADIAGKTAVVLNAPFTVLLTYLQLIRAVQARSRPDQLYLLSSASSELRVTRASSHSLRLELARGFLYRPEETHYRADARALGDAGPVELAGMRASVHARTSDGRPKVVEFSFAEALESERYLFRAYRAGALLAWRPPAIGQSERFPREDFFEVIASELLP